MKNYARFGKEIKIPLSQARSLYCLESSSWHATLSVLSVLKDYLSKSKARLFPVPK